MPKLANKPIIAVDIDEVLTPHFQDLIYWYNNQYGTKLTLANNHPKTVEGWGTNTIEEAVKRVHKFFETESFKNSQPFEEAVSATKRISEHYEMVIVTSRDTLVEQITREWLNDYFPKLFQEVHFTAFYSLNGKARSKASVAKDAGVSYMIDDSLDHIIAAAEMGIKGLLFGNYPWNQAETLPIGVARVKDWQGILEYFENEQGR